MPMDLVHDLNLLTPSMEDERSIYVHADSCSFFPVTGNLIAQIYTSELTSNMHKLHAHHTHTLQALHTLSSFYKRMPHSLNLALQNPKQKRFYSIEMPP